MMVVMYVDICARTMVVTFVDVCARPCNHMYAYYIQTSARAQAHMQTHIYTPHSYAYLR